MTLAVVIGGTRSGKSRRAEQRAVATGRPVRYVATADGDDPSMADRIAAHAARRPASWSTVEAGDDLAGALDGTRGACVLVDGLGLWIARRLARAGAFDDAGLLPGARADVLAAVGAFADRASAAPEPVIVVAEEAGQGLLPAEQGARAWLDLHGESIQRLAGAADEVELVVAGRPLPLGGAARPAPAGDLRGHGDTDVRPGDADHAVNVVAGGPPSWLRAALNRALDADAARYPDESEAVCALAALHGRDPAEIVPTNGAAEALWLLPAALRPRLAACVHPGFTEAEAALRAAGVPVARALRDPAGGFALDPASVPEEADVVVVGNPASPSGTLDPAGAILALRRRGRVVVVDEAFMDLVPGQPASLVRERLEDVIVVRSLTKALAVPGLRVGYAVAPAALAARMRDVRPPWSANALALAALAAAARRPEELAAVAERADRERADLAARLSALPGVTTWASATNFCLVEVADGPGVVEALRAERVAVRPAASFPGLGPGHLRITAREPAANARLAGALERAVASCG